jgi:hypothetical protein
MIQDNRESKEVPKEEPKTMCQFCKHWATVLVSPDKKVGIGVCHSEGSDDIRMYGIVTSHEFACHFFDRKEEKRIRQPVKRIIV